jgi:hypothetical protein
MHVTQTTHTFVLRAGIICGNYVRVYVLVLQFNLIYIPSISKYSSFLTFTSTLNVLFIKN